jgi:hypothetical protein
MDWKGFLEAIETNVSDFSEWCIEEARILENSPRFKELLIGA